jgi:hypothetical protein
MSDMKQANPLDGLLTADGPDPGFGEKLQLFGQFIGSWDLDVTALPPGAAPRRFTGEWHFGWILGGRAIQDVLIVRPLDEDPGAPPSPSSAGTSVRAYDPMLDAWWVAWLGPDDREFSTLLARPIENGIVIEGQWSLGLPDGGRFRWSFSEIDQDRFRWQGRISRDAGQTWQLVEEMQARRR